MSENTKSRGERAFDLRVTGLDLASVAVRLKVTGGDAIATLTTEIDDHVRETFRPEDRLTRQQAAAVLHVTAGRLAQLRRAGEIQHEKNPHTKATRYVYRDVAALKRVRDSVELTS